MTHRVKRAAAVLAVCGLVSINASALAAESLAKAKHPSSPTIAPLKGLVVKTISSKLSQKLPTSEELAQLRATLQPVLEGKDMKAAGRAERLVAILEIAQTKDAAARRAKLSALEVTIFEEPAVDGRKGIVRTFVAGGKIRVTLFLSRPARASELPSPSGGPSAPEATGRWKQGDVCYWDENDSGADQCSPAPGRWKIGSEGCYFDGYDDGPDQCEPAINGNETGDTPGYACYDEESSPGDCATQPQFEDFVAAVAQAESDYEEMETEYEATEAAITEYCNNNPSDPGCDEGGVGSIRSGPSGDDKRAGCFWQALACGVGLLTLAARLISSLQVALGPAATAAAATVSSHSLLLAAAGLAVGGALYAYVVCKFNLVPALFKQPLFRQNLAY